MGKLGAQCLIDQQALVAVAVVEAIGNLAFARDLVRLDDPADLRTLFVGAGLGIALGRQLSIALDPFGVQALCVDLIGRRQGYAALP